MQRNVLQRIAIAGSRSLRGLRSGRWRRAHSERSHSGAAARAVDERRNAAASLGAKRARNHVSAEFDLVEEQYRGVFPHETRPAVHEQHLQSPRKRGNVATSSNSIRITCRKNPVLARTADNRGNGSGFGCCGIGTADVASPAQRNTIPQQDGIAGVSGIVEFVRRGGIAALVPRGFVFGGKSRNLIGRFLLVDHSIEAGRRFGGIGNHCASIGE